jgi:hypothetical protein
VAFVSRQGNPILRLLEPVVFGGACALVLNLLGWLCHIEYDGKTALITLIASIVTVLLFVGFRSRRLFPVPGGMVLGEKHITLCPEGLRQSSVAHESLFRWPLVRRIGETPRHIFVMLDRNAGVIIPRSSFLTPQECEGFLAELKKLSGKP